MPFRKSHIILTINFETPVFVSVANKMKTLDFLLFIKKKLKISGIIFVNLKKLSHLHTVLRLTSDIICPILYEIISLIYSLDGVGASQANPICGFYKMLRKQNLNLRSIIEKLLKLIKYCV